jgi:hypothetical protein
MNKDQCKTGAKAGTDDKLRLLRRALADAWWNEEPLERIEQLEREINRCLAESGRKA